LLKLHELFKEEKKGKSEGLKDEGRKDWDSLE